MRNQKSVMRKSWKNQDHVLREAVKLAGTFLKNGETRFLFLCKKSGATDKSNYLLEFEPNIRSLAEFFDGDLVKADTFLTQKLFEFSLVAAEVMRTTELQPKWIGMGLLFDDKRRLYAWSKTRDLLELDETIPSEGAKHRKPIQRGRRFKRNRKIDNQVFSNWQKNVVRFGRGEADEPEE